jgi:hypothetical protein
MKTAVRDQVEGMDTASFLTLLAALMKNNPPYAEDAPVLARLSRIGLVPGQDFDTSKIATAPGIKDVPKLAVERIAGHFQSAGEDLNGWVFVKPGGRYGTDYLQRAFVTRFGLGCNLTADAVYPSTTKDAAGDKLDGANKYVMRFPRGQTPPVRGFWSLTMYDAQYFFVANPLNRYTLSARNTLKADPDGTIPLFIQASSPGTRRRTGYRHRTDRLC